MSEEERRADIQRAVENSISAIVDLFEKEATRFFTENDLVCCFQRMLHEAVDEMGVATVLDLDGKPHNLIHCEYPTPFRCDMGGKRFEIKTDEDRTPGGRKYRRGRFDVVVLNPSFIGKHSYSAIKGQNYAAFQSAVLTGRAEADPIVLYGIEFVFCRDEIKPSKGEDWEKAANDFVAKVCQDAKKLRAAVEAGGYMSRATMLAFVKGTGGKVMESITRNLDGLPSVVLTKAP